MASAATSFARSGRKVVAIGRNYLDHIKELKNQIPAEPFFFLKPTSSYITTGQNIEIPQGIVCHHEVELGVVIGSKCRDVAASDAMKFVAGYTLAIDLTARNFQDKVRQQGLPWSAAKGFDTFCPIGNLVPSQSIKDPHSLSLWLKVNGAFKQKGVTSDMMFKIPDLIRHCSSIMTLEEGDLLLTGTPSGVGPIKPGDKILAGLEQEGQLLDTLEHDIVARSGGYIFVA